VRVELLAVIETLTRLSCHDIHYGFLYESTSGLPFRMQGRAVVQATEGYPRGCLPAASVRQVAGHVSALPHLVTASPEHGGALLITPAYARDEDGLLVGRHVVVTRLYPGEPPADIGLAGDSDRARAWIFDWHEFGEHAPGLAVALTRLRAPVICDDRSREDRMAQPVTLVRTAVGRSSEPSRGIDVLRGALCTGTRLRLGRAFFADEAAFLTAFCAALSVLPSGWRGHISASAGLHGSDDDVQIVWDPQVDGLDPLGPLADALAGVGLSVDPAAFGSNTLSIDDQRTLQPFCDVFTIGVGFRGLHRHVRDAIRVASPAAVAATPSAWVQDWPSGAAREMLVRLCQDRRWALAFTVPTPSAEANPGRALWSLSDASAAVYDAMALLDLIHAADWEAWLPAQALRGRAQAAHTVCGWLAAHACPSIAVLHRLDARPGPRSAIASAVEREEPAVVDAVRRGLVAAGMSMGFTSPQVLHVAGGLLPRCDLVHHRWRDLPGQLGCLAQALAAIPTRQEPPDSDTLDVMADALLKAGRWGLVRDTMVRSLTAISGPGGGDYANNRSEANICRVISTLARAMERASVAEVMAATAVAASPGPSLQRV
jgi:hypothetical protein